MPRPRVSPRRVAHKSTGEIPPKIPVPVDPAGNAPDRLTPHTVALSATQSPMMCILREIVRNSRACGADSSAHRAYHGLPKSICRRGNRGERAFRLAKSNGPQKLATVSSRPFFVYLL